ncbi:MULTISPECIES: 3-phosphoshikimate 1-carboxyvinyltransferase [Coprobacillaceae]|uniref:3-phosphoshikimate 1-carboxyvinyltransferase n=1 Tax=Coprobacillaceae TaxID=2810280 RepID=UPI000E509E27|nr:MULTISPECIES: 3-phosphoshikimate 1-carboxyvinyltransferase [Coprobacillaceae]RHM58888.1 3-phosphoshikimate 1-carboxyvinyltransferase [Coprobacillus sp. AF33-1AC]RHS91239.1 3-phosphoshikimate 1-carboxyvinyltransferase [Erysipelatoclostridium sp. AM42-17]
MSQIKLNPTKLKGQVSVPPSKSLAHRAIIAASLSNGQSRIDNIEYSQDIKATIKAMEALGTRIEQYDDYLIIDGKSTFSKNNTMPGVEIDCEESGSTLRFMVPISIAKENKVRFIGRGNLGKRPLDTFYEIFERQNIGYLYRENVLDLNIVGTLKPDLYRIPGHISSQFITGLLFALPLLSSDSIIEITTPLESKGYIDLTLDVLKLYGIEIINHNYKQFIVRGRQEYQARDYRVEADFSQAAFYLVAGALNNDVTLMDLNLNSLQGDKATIDFLQAMNCTLEKKNGGIQVVSHGLQHTVVDASQCPDVIPVVTLALALSKGHSEVINASRLRIKECDRLSATVLELNKLGAKVIEHESSMEIEGVDYLTGGAVSSHDDHRMAMMLAIASTVCKEPMVIDNKECVKKSYPSFWEDFAALGGKIDASDI